MSSAAGKVILFLPDQNNQSTCADDDNATVKMHKRRVVDDVSIFRRDWKSIALIAFQDARHRAIYKYILAEGYDAGLVLMVHFDHTIYNITIQRCSS